jgi:hypothetical protein
MNSNGDEVYLTTLTVGDTNKGENLLVKTRIVQGSVGMQLGSTADAKNNVYGIKDVSTDSDGKLYLWLPSDNDVLMRVSDGTNFYQKDPVSIATDNTTAATLSLETTGSGGDTTNGDNATAQTPTDPETGETASTTPAVTDTTAETPRGMPQTGAAHSGNTPIPALIFLMITAGCVFVVPRLRQRFLGVAPNQIGRRIR